MQRRLTKLHLHFFCIICVLLCNSAVSQNTNKPALCTELESFMPMLGTWQFPTVEVLGNAVEVTGVSDLVVRPSADGQSITTSYSYRLRRYNGPAKNVEVVERLFWDSTKKRVLFDGDLKVDGKSIVEEKKKRSKWKQLQLPLTQVYDSLWKAYMFPNVVQFEIYNGNFASRTLNSPDNSIQIVVSMTIESDSEFRLDDSLEPVAWMVGNWQSVKTSDGVVDKSNEFDEYTSCGFDGYMGIYPIHNGESLEVCYGFTQEHPLMDTDHYVVRERITKSSENDYFNVSTTVDLVTSETGNASIGKPRTYHLRAQPNGDFCAYVPMLGTTAFVVRPIDEGVKRTGFVGLGFSYRGGRFNKPSEGYSVWFKDRSISK